jgi:hypothetical protein
MTDQKRFQYLLERFRKLDAGNNPYRFSVVALFDDPQTPQFQCANKEKGAQKLEDAVMSAVKSLKPDSFRIDKYPNSSAETPDESVEIRVTNRSGSEKAVTAKQEKAAKESKEKDRSVIDKLDEYLSRLESVENERVSLMREKEVLNAEKVSLLGSINDQNIEKVRHEHKLAMIEFRHDLDIQERERKIRELEEEISDLQTQLTEALGIVDDYQQRIEREGKLESSARDITALAKGALSVAPGLMKIANQFGLGGIASALADDGGDHTLPSSADSQGMAGEETDNARFENIQEIVRYCNNLSDSDLEGFMLLTKEFEKNPSSLKEFIGLVKP